MKATYIAPDIIVTEYTEGETLLTASSEPKVEIDDDTEPDYWTMGAKQETTRPGRYHAWNDDDDSLDY